MAPAKNLQSHTKKSRAPSRKTSNALGYAKRQAAKDKRPSKADVEDVYEYQPEKVRRAKVKLQYEREELMGAGAEDSDEDDGDGAGNLGRGAKPRLIGEGEDDERIGSDEDEDIDSDEAFDESDEERFAGFGFSQKVRYHACSVNGYIYSYAAQKKSSTASRKKASTAGPSRSVRFAEVDLNEDDDEAGPSFAQKDASEASGSDEEQESDSDEEEEEEGDPDEFIDVLDVLDGRGEPESGDEDRQDTHESTRSFALSAVKETSHVDIPEDEEMQELGSEDDDDAEGGEDEEDAEESDQEQISASEDEDEGDVSALDNLRRFVTSLDAGQKRKSPEPEAGDAVPKVKKRRLLPERTVAGEENEFAAHIGRSPVLSVTRSCHS